MRTPARSQDGFDGTEIRKWAGVSVRERLLFALLMLVAVGILGLYLVFSG